MGIADIPIAWLNRRKIGRQLRSPQFNEDNPIHAFDTETRQDGQIYLLSYAFDDSSSGHIGNSDFSPLSSDDLLSMFVHHQTRQPAVNVWYNLDFDANAFFGTVFSERQLTELADTNQTTFEHNNIDYELTYINGKFLTIKDNNRHTSTHYDISQFFNSSLDKAAHDWLGTEKHDIDPTKREEYEWKTITEYAEYDAFLTRELWETFVELGENELGIPLGKPISTGYISQNVVFDELYQKPRWGNSQFQDLARQSYHGGRFEVYRRGLFDSVIGLDINSAYPYHMARMPDLGGCDIQIIGGNIETLQQCDWGFVDITVSTDSTRNIQPFAVKLDQVTFPALQNHRLVVTREEFLFALEHEYLTDYTIHQMGIVWERDNVKRPFSYLSNWYDDRNTYKNKIKEKNDMNDKFQYILKVIMNSTYGKTCQIVEKSDYLDPDKDYSTDSGEFLTEGYAGDMLKNWYEPGDLFNPFYATYITALTRLQLHKAVLELEVESQTILLATDCVMIEKNAVSQSAIDSMIEPTALGAWDFDYDGSAFVIGSGVYDVIDDGKIEKLASRGFTEVTKAYDSWRDAAKQATNNEIVLHNERPARFKEWLRHDAHPRPAEFFHDERTLTPNFDVSRQWDKDTTFTDLLQNTHGSQPIIHDEKSTK